MQRVIMSWQMQELGQLEKFAWERKRLLIFFCQVQSRFKRIRISAWWISVPVRKFSVALLSTVEVVYLRESCDEFRPKLNS